MSDQITTAAELDALPDASVLLLTVRLLRADRAAAAIKREGKWYLTGVFTADGYGYTSRDLMDDTTGPLTVLYRPDAPARTEPTEEQVARVICDADAATLGYERRLPDGDYDDENEWRLYLGHARAVLALLPQRVAPSVRELAIWMHDNLGCSLDGCECVDKFEYYRSEAHNLAELFASQPTVAEVKAEAWDEGYTRGFYDRERMSPYIEGRDASEGATANPYRQEDADA